MRGFLGRGRDPGPPALDPSRVSFQISELRSASKGTPSPLTSPFRPIYFVSAAGKESGDGVVERSLGGLGELGPYGEPRAVWWLGGRWTRRRGSKMEMRARPGDPRR